MNSPPCPKPAPPYGGLFDQWLAWLLAGLLVFTGLPLLAPVLMVAGWTGAGEFLYQVYALFCHQLPQRSWFFFGAKLTYSVDELAQVYPVVDAAQLRAFVGTAPLGWKVAWSDRMVSFYTMIPIFGLVYAAMRRSRRQPRPLSWRVLFVALLPLVVDGVTHALSDWMFGISGGGFRDTNKWLAFRTNNAFPAFYVGDHWGTFNAWLRLLSGVLAAWGIAFFLFPTLDRLIAHELQQPCPPQE